MRSKLTKSAPFILLGLIFLMLLILNLFCQDHWLDSDMAAEMMFSKLLSEEGHLFATTEWYYSTEFRVLYTQLLMGPLFGLLEDWHVIRTITNLAFYGLLLASYLYFMKPFKVSKGLTALTACVLFLPFSETMMTHMQMGNTYMSHVILIYLFFGMFLRLAQKQKIPQWRKVLLLVCYGLLGLVCGISGVRYLLALQCPLVMAAFLFLLKTEEFGSFRLSFPGDCRERMTALLHSRQAAYFYYSLLGAICSVLGYGVNMVWVSRQYVFQTYGATNFIPLYQGVLFERLQNAVGCLLMLFGYIPDRGVISLRGLITVTAFVLLGVFVFCGRRVYRSAGHREPDARFFATLFLAVSFALNFFVFVFTTSTMVPRYYITILMFALPVLAFYLEGEAPAFDKTAVCLILGACLALGTVKTVASFVTVDKNESKRPVAEFLAENDYTFGFATYTNANIITELTEGQVEIANVGDPEYLEYFKWSSPVRYYEEGYHSGETFLLLTAEETAAYEGARALQAGQIIYEDGNYVIYRYDSVEELMNCAKNR